MVKKCATCGKAICPEGFRDELSYREHKISGMCQTCQDIAFAEPEEEEESYEEEPAF